MNEKNMVEYLFIIVCLNHRIGAETLDCNFDKDFCEWRQDDNDDFNWERERGNTPSKNTGPTSDHTTGSGHYIYTEASSNEEGDNSRIISPVQLSGQYCLTFWYSMYGRDIGALSVYLATKNYESIIFRNNKNIGNPRWQKSVLNIKANESYQIVFEGVIGDDSKGDIAIDDISIQSSLCTIDCDFEVDLCNWMQYNDDDFDWQRTDGGHYIYIASNFIGSAAIISPVQNAGKYCLSFLYLMYGSRMGRLQIQLWSLNGSKINMDQVLSVHISAWYRKITFISSGDSFQIVIEGTVNNWYTHDGIVAIDNVILSSCHDCVDPTPSHGIVSSTNYEYGSVIKIQCEHGYILKGDSVIVCKAMGSWNGTAECIAHDCRNFTIQNGTFIAPNGTTYGQIGRQECDAGFALIGEQSIICTVNGWSNTSAYCKFIDCENITIQNGTFITPNGTTYGQIGRQECDGGFALIGEQSIRCTVNGWSNTSAYCKFVDCGNFTIHNGTFVTANGTTFGQVGRQECDTGFDLIGEQDVICTVNGWSNTSAYCKIIDCGNLTIHNGMLITPNGKTYGQFGRRECDTGFVLIGEQSIRCTVDGWSNTSAYCQIIEPGSSFLVVVYVLAPVIVVIVGVLIIAVYIRRRHPSCIKILKTDGNTRNEPPDVSNHTYSNGAVQLDEEYATIAEEQNKKDTVYYTTVNKKSTKKPGESQSDSVNKTAGEGFRNGFNKIDALSTKDLNRNTRSERSEEQDSNCIYDNTCTGKINSKPLKYGEEQDSNYDNTCTGTINSKPLNYGDYSHIGDLDMEYQHLFNLDMQTNMQTNTDYSHINGVNMNPRFLKHLEGNNSNVYQNSIVKDQKKIFGEQMQNIKNPEDHESDYYNVGTDVADREGHFVLQDEERKNESDESEKHEYFILEKM